MSLKLKLIILISCTITHFIAQTSVYRDTIKVFEAGVQLDNPWAGGINFSNFSAIDLNLDGKKDIVSFDKMSPSGFGKLRTFLNVGTVGVAKYKHAPQYESLIPKVEDWALFIDYNNDNKIDLFTYTLGGIRVYKNTSIGTSLQFTLAKTILYSNYNPGGLPNMANIYCNSIALPGLADIDADGDLDVLTYSVFGIKMEYHINKSMELYGIPDSLVYERADDCWGDIQESTCIVFLEQCPYPKTESASDLNPSSKILHAGSCIMCFDRDGDGDQDAILGDVSCSSVHYIENTGSITNAHITDTTVLYPNYPLKSSINRIKLNSFPCTYYLDVDNDGFKDLLASPNTVAGAENYQSVWYYKNTSTTPTVNFSFQKKNFLQDGMIELGEGAYPVLFDIDNDGFQDLFIGNVGYYNGFTNISKLAYYHNIGTFSSPSYSLITRDYQGFSSYGLFQMIPTFGDIDGDGDKDLIIGQNNGQLAFFKNTATLGGPAVFTTAPVMFYSSIDVGTNAYPQLFDLDKNGLLDLIIGSINGKISYYKNVGTTSLPSFTLITNSLGNVDVRLTGSLYGYSTPFAFDDAGVTKLMVGSEYGNLFYYNNIDGNLTGTFNNVDTNLFKINNGVRCAPFYEDVTGDGKRDLFIGNYAGGVTFYNSTNVNSVGLNEIQSIKNAIIYPNPTHHLLTIQIDSDFLDKMNIEIFDIIGKEVYTTTTFNKTTQVDVSLFAKGIYFIKIINSKNNTIYTSKFIVE